MALPIEVDFEGPLAEDIIRYLDTDTATSRERVQLFRLAWDLSGSAFGSRQVLYERYFQGDWMRNAGILWDRYDVEPMMDIVRDFLGQP